MKKKSDTYELFISFQKLVENYFQTKIISVFSDNGGEYHKLKSHFLSVGISHYTTPPHTPEHNGTAERRHRHIVETGLSLLHHASLPISYWSHAFQVAVYLINRLPSSALSFHTPYFKLFGKDHTVGRLKSFGCLCFPWLRPYNSSKLQSRSLPCIFLGYSATQSAYKCWDPKNQRLYISRHVKFVEHIYPNLSPDKYHSCSPLARDSFCAGSTHSGLPIPTVSQDVPTVSAPPISTADTSMAIQQVPSGSDLQEFQDTSLSARSDLVSSPELAAPPVSESAIVELPITVAPQATAQALPSAESDSLPVQRSSRVRKPNPRYYSDAYINLATKYPLQESLEPHTVKQAMADPQWRQAMDSEYNALLKNDTWELVPKLHSKPIGCKWVFRVKRKPDGSIDKYKARLVAKGFLQEPGKDYFETFSPVTKPVTIRVVLSLAITNGWTLRQLDVNNAFLHGTLFEDVYMMQPPGYVHSELPDYVCKLKKSLYGLKQAPRAWYNELSNFLVTLGFRKSSADASLFIYRKEDIVAYFLVYVDDIVLTGNNDSFLTACVRQLAHRFSIKDLGCLHHFLGVEVISTASGLFLTQHRYIADLLVKFNMSGAKDVHTPMSTSEKLTLFDGSPSTDATVYKQIVGSLQYLAITRPDISFAINRLSQFMHAPTQLHFQALKRVLRYLKGTISHGLHLNRQSFHTLTAFSDSDWGGSLEQGRSTTTYILYLGSNVISWKSTRQKSVSRSSTEAEYRALANAAAEVIWVQNLLQDLGMPISQPPTLYCDNIGATYFCVNPIYHTRMKHLSLIHI